MESINEDIREIVLAAIKEYDRSKEEKSRRKILYNTRLLLKNYNELKNHAENAIYRHIDNKEIEEVNQDEVTYSNDKNFIESIKNSRAKTLIYIEHMDMALERVKNNQKIKGTDEKYKAFEMFYIEKVRIDDIAIKLNCSSKSASRWIKEVTEEVGVNMFGINSLEHIFV